MTPNLLSEEPPAQTSAKEPWVSDSVQSSLRGLFRQECGMIICFSPFPSSLMTSISRSFLKLLVPLGLGAEAHHCTNVP